MKYIKKRTITTLWLHKFSLPVQLFKLSLASAIIIFWGYFNIPIITTGAPVDLIPPEITTVSPAQDSVIATGTPWIEARFGDSGSGIDEKTILLVLDQINVTDQALIENIDISVQAMGLYKIRYQPRTPLNQGSHEVYFRVRDQAGNLAELRWNFTVALSGQNGFDISGSNTLQWDQYPLGKVNDTWNMAALAKFANTDLRLGLSGHGADYPAGTPLFHLDEYNFYLDRYSLGLQHRKSALVMGYGVSPVQSEIFQGGMEIKGGIFTQKNDFTRGQLNWALFSGETASSYGLGISVNPINGAACRWESISGWKMGVFYVEYGGPTGSDLIGFYNNTQFGDGFLARFELVSRNSKSDDVSGNGFAAHLDKSFPLFDIGLDYILLQPGFAVSAGSVTYSPEQRGLRRMGVRTSTTLYSLHNIGLDILAAEDNLDHTNEHTIKQGNFLFNYNFAPDTGFNLNINYSGGFQSDQGGPGNSCEKINNTLSFNVKKKLNLSTLQTSFFLEGSQLPGPETSNQAVFFSAWTCPIGGYILTPSLRLTKKTESDNSFNQKIETRITLDYQIHSKAPRSKVALLWNSGNESLSDGQIIQRGNLGLESSVNLLLWHNSTLSATFNLSYWNRNDNIFLDGWDKTLSFTWRYNF